jgi:signal transduction histidine kinase
VRVAPDAARAYTDASKLGVCLNAVVSNAVKFTTDGLIAINADRIFGDGREWLTISVSDTGIGMSPEDLPRVFQPFTQIDATSTRAKGGMGLGLSISQRMAHAIGGEVTVTSELGAGSTFMIRVPLRLERPATERAAA